MSEPTIVFRMIDRRGRQPFKVKGRSGREYAMAYHSDRYEGHVFRLPLSTAIAYGEDLQRGSRLPMSGFRIAAVEFAPEEEPTPPETPYEGPPMPPERPAHPDAIVMVVGEELITARRRTELVHLALEALAKGKSPKKGRSHEKAPTSEDRAGREASHPEAAPATA